MDQYYLAHFVKPKDGLIKLNRTNTFGIGLDSDFEYIVEFYDRNFFLISSNPDVVSKNMLMIKKNVYSFIYLKVNSFISTSKQRVLKGQLRYALTKYVNFCKAKTKEFFGSDRSSVNADVCSAQV